MIKTCWELHYKAAATDDQNESRNDNNQSDDLFSSQMKRAKFDSRDELQVYLAETAVSSTAPSMKHGPLGWWQVRVRKTVFEKLFLNNIATIPI